jgi:hypothetical protein
MPPLVRSGDAGTRAIAKEMLGQMSAPLDRPELPFDDTWIQEIKVCAVQVICKCNLPALIKMVVKA